MASSKPVVEGHSFVVTGSSGLCGQRLVEMLIERGAKRVVAFDFAPPPEDAIKDARVTYIKGDICNKQSVFDACEGSDCVFHLAALVGPFYERSLYFKVNYEGSLNVLEACRFHKVPRLVVSSSPSTRFTGANVRGAREEECPVCPAGQFLEPYAESKAMGEVAIRQACCESLMTVAVAPHQVFGPRDGLFLPNILAAAETGRLRVFGSGDNDISVCYVDNYCWGCILGYTSLYTGSPSLGKYYVITDGGRYKLWRLFDDAIVHLGIPSVFTRFALPVWFLYFAAYLLLVIGKIFNTKFKLTPFTVTMLTIDRWFDITNAEKDLGYKPLVDHDTAWKLTLDWFKDHGDWWRSRATLTTAKASSKTMK